MDQGEQKVVVKLPPPYNPIKYLVSSLNTFFGNALVQKLRNDHIHPQNPNRIVGTTSNHEPQMATPEGVRKIIDTTKVTFFQDLILNSDVIIYDLNTCDLKQIEFVITTLKINNYTQEKVLICVSDVMTWANTAPKIKKQGEQEEGDDNPIQQPDSEEETDPQGENQEKKTYVRFTDKDFHLRKPHIAYEKIKSIETLCLAAGNTKPNLKTYVVCSGILYGCGERIFAPYFLQARLQIPQALHYFGKGKNRIPLIHLKDLVTYIQKIIQKRPKIPYILATDHNPKPTLKKIMEAISKGIGTGKVVSEQPNPNIKNVDILQLNLRVKPTMYFAKLQEQQAAIQQQQGNQIPKFKFAWQSKEGLQKNIQKLCKEYNQARKLSQQKVLIIGPPGCGKTHYAEILAQKYYLPHIHIKAVINQVKQMQNQLGEQVRNYLNQKKQSEIQTKQAQYDELKEKNKKIPKQFREALEPFDPEKVEVKLSQELVYKCFKWRLSQNDCLNRGYILDGYPRKYEDACEIFMGIPAVEQGQQGGQQNQKKVLDQRLVCRKIMILEQSDQDILRNMQLLGQEKVNGTHLTEKQIKRRLKIYRNNMNATTGDLILSDFFKENKINVSHINVSSQTLSILQSLIKPIGTDEEYEVKTVEKRVEEQLKERAAKREQMGKREAIIKNIQNQDYLMKKQNEQNEERQILDKKSLALRKYLDVNVVPILSQGIIQILHDFPNDPVDKLAQFLFKNSLRVPNPDPSTFQFLDS